MHLSWEALVPDFSIPWPGISTRVASMPSRPSGRRGSWSQGLSTGSDSLMWPFSASPFNFERDVKESRTCRQTCQNAQLSIVSSILKCTREHPNLRPDWFQLPCCFLSSPGYLVPTWWLLPSCDSWGPRTREAERRDRHHATPGALTRKMLRMDKIG